MLIQIFSLNNNFAPLDTLVEQSNSETKFFDAREYDFVIEVINNLHSQMESLIEEAKKQKEKLVQEEGPVAKRARFGGGKRKTQKKHRFSKKAGRKGNKSKSRKTNRKTTRSKK